LAPLVAEACAAWLAPPERVARGPWDELGVRFAAAAVRLAADPAREPRRPANAERGIARAVRLIDKDPGAPLDLGALALEANLSHFHFVRAFARVTGLTPHKYVMRTRLRSAAVRLATTGSRVIDVAQTCGFGDVSNFNHAFRAEFGMTPREQRARLKRRH
jgi:AraC-like DNA-binding protein